MNQYKHNVLANHLRDKIKTLIRTSPSIRQISSSEYNAFESLLQKADLKELESLYYILGIEQKHLQEIEQSFLQKANTSVENFFQDMHTQIKKISKQ